MTGEMQLLGPTALALYIGVAHTAAGPDHYLPFVAMSRAQGWSFSKTMWITVAGGVAHVASSVIIGAVGIALGIVLLNLETIESVRGDLAGWMLAGFGAIYLLWAIVHAIRFRTPEPETQSADGSWSKLTPWILITIFLFGPCEPLIPMLMYPASQGSFLAVAWVAIVFGLATVGTMTTLVALLLCGSQAVFAIQRWEKEIHLAAGMIVLGSGLAIIFGL